MKCNFCKRGEGTVGLTGSGGGGSGKWRAVVMEIDRMVKAGRPVLVGTTSVERSEHLSRLLSEKGTG